ncbi:MAG: HDOD domain-containing protein [FCB group bacterium]|nr:HDOD domain-containing protein [FCB group bacterium]
MTEENIFKLLKDNKELSSLPQVLAEVIRVADRDECSASEIADVILKDPSLSARMLRIVNSSFYGQAREITTINQSVVTLGVRAVKAMALSAGLYRLFENENSVVDRIRFWRHSLEVAIACREIAKACGYQPAEEAFVAGLMHDLGILVLESNFSDRFRHVWNLVEAGESLIKLEEENWSTNHCRVGRFLLTQWGIPSLIGDSIAGHHDEFSDENNTPQHRLSRIVSLANHISKFRICQLPPMGADQIEQIDSLAGSLGIGPTTLADLQEKTISRLIKESEFLDLKVGSTTDLLLDANSLIYKQYLLVESVLRENRQMQAQIARDQLKKAALESLKTITATLSHYINNASATILGRAQLVQLAVDKGTVVDSENVVDDSMEIVVSSVETISLVLDELKKLSSFDTTHYHDETSILDIEDRLKEHINRLDPKKLPQPQPTK